MWLFIYQSLGIRSSRVSNQVATGENVRCILFMIAAMAGFAIEDAVIKQLSYSMPVSQVLMLIGCGGVLTFGVTAMLTQVNLFAPEVTKPWFVLEPFLNLHRPFSLSSRLFMRHSQCPLPFSKPRHWPCHWRLPFF